MDKKKRAFIAIFIVIGAAALLAAVAAAVGWLNDTAGFALRDISFADYRVWLIWGGIILAFGAVILYDRFFRVNRRVLKANKDLEDSHWLTKDEIRKNKGLAATKLSKLGKTDDGIPVTAKLSGSDINIILAKPTHVLTLGTTGSGKTTTFVDPTIEILCRTKTKPSVVVTDPKGELYKRHANTLKAQGYRVWAIDLNDPWRSTKWNPFHDVWKKTDRIANAKYEWSRGKYVFNGKAYPTRAEAERHRAVFVQEAQADIFTDLQELCYTMCPVAEGTESASWQRGARDLLFALALGFWEDVRDQCMSRKQFNLFNLFENMSRYCKGECETLIEYFDGRDEFSRTRGLSNTVLVTKDRTLASYMGDVNQYLSWMADMGISALTSDNGVEFLEFDEEPTALFLKIPDHKENRHKLVTLFITQMYKALVDKAADNEKRGRTKAAELLRGAYFIMDEFGNMPKFYRIEGMFTVGRSRKIWMLPVIQDFMQIDTKYGREAAAIIRSSCPIKIFIQASDDATTEEFSKLCGKRKVGKVSYSEGKGRDVTVSTGAEEKPLIYASELRTLNDAAAGRMGQAVVLAAGRHPLRAAFTPIFEAKGVYGNEDADDPAGEAVLFEEKEYFYDIAKQNAFARIDKGLRDNTERPAGDDPASPPDGDPESESEARDKAERRLMERAKAEGKRLYLEIEAFMSSKLKRILPAGEYAALESSSLLGRIALLEKLIEAANERKNNILLFNLMLVKQFIFDRGPDGALVKGA
jgi:type IV secretion system protein VirD4